MISPTGKWVPLSFKLEYEATNNVAEYEALLLGLQTTGNMNIQSLKVLGDSELVVRQVRNQCQTKHPRLRAYRNEVWDVVEKFFMEFNIQFMPREQNRMDDSLAVAASTFRPPQNPLLRYEIEVRYRPSIPDNIKHWQVFEDEEQMKRFLETIGEFSNMEIDADEEEGEIEEISKGNWEEKVVGNRVLQLKGNIITRGMVPLEILFDKNDVPLQPSKVVEEDQLEELNLGTEADPKIVKLSRKIPGEYKELYQKLFQS